MLHHNGVACPADILSFRSIFPIFSVFWSDSPHLGLTTPCQRKLQVCTVCPTAQSFMYLLHCSHYSVATTSYLLSVSTALYPLFHIRDIVSSTLYLLQCIHYNAFDIFCPLNCIPYNVSTTLYLQHCILYVVFTALHLLHPIYYIVFTTLYILHCIPYIVSTTLYQ